MFSGTQDSPISILIHEIIHSAGVEGRANTPYSSQVHNEPRRGVSTAVTKTVYGLTRGKHDLEWFNWSEVKNGEYSVTGFYDAIINACQPK
jgi:hypothetical protein